MTTTRLILLNAVALGGVVLMLAVSLFPVNFVLPGGVSPPTQWGLFLLQMQARPWEGLVDGAVLLALGLDVEALVREWRRLRAGTAPVSPIHVAGSDD